MAISLDRMGYGPGGVEISFGGTGRRPGKVTNIYGREVGGGKIVAGWGSELGRKAQSALGLQDVPLTASQRYGARMKKADIAGEKISKIQQTDRARKLQHDLFESLKSGTPKGQFRKSNTSMKTIKGLAQGSGMLPQPKSKKSKLETIMELYKGLSDPLVPANPVLKATVEAQIMEELVPGFLKQQRREAEAAAKTAREAAEPEAPKFKPRYTNLKSGMRVRLTGQETRNGVTGYNIATTTRPVRTGWVPATEIRGRREDLDIGGF